MKISVPFAVLSMIFCVSFIVDSFLEMKVLSLFGLPITAGFIVITISYIVSDCIVEVYGYRKAVLVMWLTFALHAMTVLLLQFACWMPAAGYWEGDVHFQFIFGMAPRITIASMLAFVAGSSTNAAVMSLLKAKYRLWGFRWRAFLSTVAGEGVDALCFFPMAFLGVIPVSAVFLMAFVQASGKIAYETLVLPVTERVAAAIKRKDGIDTIDEGISYNIFSFR